MFPFPSEFSEFSVFFLLDTILTRWEAWDQQETAEPDVSRKYLYEVFLMNKKYEVFLLKRPHIHRHDTNVRVNFSRKVSLKMR